MICSINTNGNIIYQVYLLTCITTPYISLSISRSLALSLSLSLYCCYLKLGYLEFW